MNLEITSNSAADSQIVEIANSSLEYNVLSQSTNNSDAQTSYRVDGGLIALYDFDEGTGNAIADLSGVGEPLDLAIDEPANVEWGEGVLTVTDDALISSESSNTKLYDKITTSNEFTLEAWIAPENSSQNGPARIATLSGDARNRNFTLGQAKTDYSFRLRTSNTNNNAERKGELLSQGGLATTDMSHVVYTWEAGTAKLYIDNQLVNSKNIGGDLTNWNQNFTFALANEVTGGRAWQGTYDLVAVYDRSLESQEIEQNYLAGGGNAVPTPKTTPEPIPTPTTTPTPVPTPTPTPGNGINLWSDPNTWGGQLPKAGSTITIPSGETIVLDVDTPDLGGVIVEGNLIFSEDHGDLDLTADWVLVRGGHLEIGTESNAYDANATITLNGADENVMDMGMGGRFLIANNGGIIDMHSASANKVSWTQLSAHANPGDKEIALAKSVNWQVGDEIVIAPSGFDAAEAEQRTVTAVSADGTKITLDAPLSYQHWGTIESVDGKPLDMRAEVGLLSRNIDIQAPSDAEQSKFGFHTMFMADTTARISGVEFFRGGQLGNAARYPFHWHFANEGSDDYIKDSSVHNSFHRGIVVHGVDNATVDSNVVYDVTSHAYVFSEDGDESNNRITNNLGILAKSFARENFAFPSTDHFQSTQGELRPSVFWGRNYYNPMTGNHAAGAEDGNGFHFDSSHFKDFETKQNVVKSNETIVFKNNVAHSNQASNYLNPHYGPRTRGHGLMIQRYGSDEGSELVFEGLTTYKNANSGVWMESGRHTLKDAVIADSSSGIVIMRSSAKDTVMTQNSPNKIGGVLGEDREFLSAGGAIPGGIHVKRSTYGVSPNVSNVTFVDFQQAAIVVHKQTTFGEDSTVEGVKLVNTQPVYWDKNASGNKGMLKDLDGSLTGTNIATGISFTSLTDGLFKQDWNAYIAPI